jgi:hypothetical protein
VPVITADFYPTFVAGCGLKADPGHRPDGVSLVPLLKAPKAALGRDALYWHYPLERPHFLGGRSRGAIRKGDLKLIEDFTTGKLELYDLKKDPGERNDLAEAMPEPARRLHEELKAWRRSVGAKAVPHAPPKGQDGVRAGGGRYGNCTPGCPVPRSLGEARGGACRMRARCDVGGCVMDESALRSDPRFWGHLPIYNEGDEQCASLRRPDDPAYERAVVEAGDEAEFRRLIQDPGHELRGAIRHGDAEVRAVFWRRRGEGRPAGA